MSLSRAQTPIVRGLLWAPLLGGMTAAPLVARLAFGETSAHEPVGVGTSAAVVILEPGDSSLLTRVEEELHTAGYRTITTPSFSSGRSDVPEGSLAQVILRSDRVELILSAPIGGLPRRETLPVRPGKTSQEEVVLFLLERIRAHQLRFGPQPTTGLPAPSPLGPLPASSLPPSASSGPAPLPASSLPPSASGILRPRIHRMAPSGLDATSASSVAVRAEPPANESPPTAQRRPTPPSTRSPRREPRFAAFIDATALVQPSQHGWSEGLLLGFDTELRHRSGWGARISGASSVVEGRTSAVEGQARLGLLTFDASLGFTHCWRALGFGLDVGALAARLTGEGTANDGLRGHKTQTWSAVAFLRPRVQLELAVFRLRGELMMGWAFPESIVRFAEREVARWGSPVVWVGLAAGAQLIPGSAELDRR